MMFPMVRGRPTTQLDVSLAEISRRANRDAIIARGVVTVAAIAASYMPLMALQGIAESLPGHTIKIDVTVVVNIVVALSLALKRHAGI